MRIGVILGPSTGSGATAVFGKMGAVRDGDDSGSGYEGRLVSYCRAFIIIKFWERRFYALANLMYYALVIMRRQKAIFTVYLAAAAAAVLSGLLVSKLNQCSGRLLSAAYDRIMIGFGLYTAGAYQSEKRRMPVMEEVTRNTEIADGREARAAGGCNHTHLQARKNSPGFKDAFHTDYP